MPKFLSAAFALVCAGALGAQQPAPSYIVTRLGTDTVGIERYTRTSNKLEGDLVLRYPRTRTFHYVANLGPRGEITSVTTTVRRANTDAAAPPLMQLTTTFSDSVATLEGMRGGSRDTVISGRKIYHGGALPTLFTEPPAFGPYEQILASSRLGRDSVVYALVGPGGPQVPSIILKRGGRDTVSFTSTFFPAWVEVATVDSRGGILSVDASATTVKTKAERVASLDFDKVVAAWAARDVASGGAIGQMSPPDTTRAAIGGANISVAYSRPLRRGRTIFGNVVPYNQVWRTGANAATVFTTDKDLVFGSTTVPAGKYTLWTLPSPTSAKLIINSETGQWGTDYHAEKDFTRLDLGTRQLSQPVDQFIIDVAPQGPGGVLRMAWDNMEYAIPFTVKQ